MFLCVSGIIKYTIHGSFIIIISNFNLSTKITSQRNCTDLFLNFDLALNVFNNNFRDVTLTVNINCL